VSGAQTSAGAEEIDQHSGAGETEFPRENQEIVFSSVDQTTPAEIGVHYFPVGKDR
jgi:hypothetical protein